MCLAQGPQRSDAGEARTCGPRSQVKHSTTEPLHSLYFSCISFHGFPLLSLTLTYPVYKTVKIQISWLLRSGPKVIKLFSYTTQLSTKFILLLNVKMPTIVGILTFICMINTTSKRLKARNFFICRYFSFNE